jgi:hypothetical protein
MSTKLVFCVMLAGSIGWMSCNRSNVEPEKSNEAEYLFFGTNFGRCGGNCYQVYLLTSSELWQYIAKPSEPIKVSEFTAKGKKLSAELHAQYKNLLQIPNGLDQTEIDRFGCPNCYDQGEILMEYKKGQKVYSFWADTKIEDNPKFLQEYFLALKKAVEALAP